MLAHVEIIGNARHVHPLAAHHRKVEPLHFGKPLFRVERRHVNVLVVLEIINQRNARIARRRRQNQRFFRLVQPFFRLFEKRRENVYGKVFYGTRLSAEKFQHVPPVVDFHQRHFVFSLEALQRAFRNGR